MKMKKKNFFKIIAKNEPGVLSDITRILSNENINIEDFVVIGFEDRGLILLSTSDQDKAMHILQDNSYYILEENGLIVKLEDRAGALAGITQLLNKNDINIDSASIVDKDKNFGYVALKVSDLEKAEVVLEKYLVKQIG